MKIWHGSLLLAIALGACGKDDEVEETDDPVLPQPDETTDTSADTGGPVADSDNDFGAATPLELDVDRDGVISPAGDVDWYSLEVDEPTWIRVDTITQGDRTYNLDTGVKIWSPSGDLYAYMDNYATGTVGTFDTVLYAYLDAPGTWGITVEDVYTFYPGYEDYIRGGPDFTYTVGVNLFTSITSEPDGPGDPSAEVLLESGASIFAVGVNIETAGDVDTIAVETQVPGFPLEVWGSSGNAGSASAGSRLAPLVRLVDPFGTLLAEKDYVGVDGYLSYFDPEAGVHTVEVSDAGVGGGESYWFVAYIRTYDEDFASPFFGTTVYEEEVEPNDTSAEAVFATPVELTLDGDPYDVGAVQGTIVEAGDVDWFGIPVGDDDDQFSIRCFTEEFGSLLDLRVTVMADGEEIASATDAEINFYYVRDVPLNGAANALVKIESEAGEGSPAAYYRCRLIVADFDIP